MKILNNYLYSGKISFYREIEKLKAEKDLKFRIQQIIDLQTSPEFRSFTIIKKLLDESIGVSFLKFSSNLDNYRYQDLTQKVCLDT